MRSNKEAIDEVVRDRIAKDIKNHWEVIRAAAFVAFMFVLVLTIPILGILSKFVQGLNIVTYVIVVLSCLYLILNAAYIASLWSDSKSLERQSGYAADSKFEEKILNEARVGRIRAARYSLIAPIALPVRIFEWAICGYMSIVKAAMGKKEKPKIAKELCPSCHKKVNKRPVG